MRENYFRIIMITAVMGLLSWNVWSQNEIAITSAEDLQKIGHDEDYPLSGSYYLTTDIDLSGINWIPIGATGLNDGYPKHFTGKLDGKGYSIKNLTIDATENVRGLFGRLNNATVKNFDLLDVDIKGQNVVGAVTGGMFGESLIERISVSGNIVANTDVGGIVGRVAQNNEYPEYNTIQDCYVTANITATFLSNDMNNPSCAGGIAGFSVGNTNGYYGKIHITRVYVTGKIISEQKEHISGNAAGILPFYNNHEYVKMNELIVLCETIEAATPNLFFCRRGPTYNELELFEHVYARTGITLNYFNDNEKGRGGEIPEGVIEYLPLDTYKTKEFYDYNLTWDFDEVWTIEEGSLPVLRRDNRGGGTGISNPHTKKNYSLTVQQNALTIYPQAEIAINIYNVTGAKVYSIQNLTAETTVTLPKGMYVLQSTLGKQSYSEKIIIK